VFAEVIEIRGRDRARRIARRVIAVDLVLVDQPFHERLGVFREIPEHARRVGPVFFDERGLELRVRTPELTAVSPGSPPADALRLQQHHLVAALCEMQRSREARVSPADHADVATAIALERWTVARWIGGRRPEGARVWLSGIHAQVALRVGKMMEDGRLYRYLVSGAA